MVRCFSCSEQGSCDSERGQFYPERSTSFAPATCDSDLCTMFSGDPSYECSENNECHYGMKYADDAVVTGLLAKESYTIWDEDSITEAVIPNVPLLCANASNASYSLDGILGLGIRRDSFPTILVEDFGISKFSYCLVDQIEERERSSTMVFGEHVLSRNNQVFYTPQSRNYQEHYAVKLVNISVEGVNIAVTSFPIDLVIDTGATISYLPRYVFRRLLNKFTSIVEGRLGWVRNTEACYNTPINIEESPSMTLHFDGENASLELKSHNIWMYAFVNETIKVACFAFDDGTRLGLNILGNTQQQNIRVIYESGDIMRVGFDPSGC